PFAYGALALLFAFSPVAHWSTSHAADGRQLLYYEAVMRTLRYGQPPFWNPWHCGGNVLWQRAEVPVISPVYLLGMIMPLTLANTVNLALHYFAALIGTHLLLQGLIKARSRST